MNKKYQAKENAKVLFTILNIVLYVLLFFVFLHFFYKTENFKTNSVVIIVLLYTFILISFGRMFEIFELGETRVYDLFLSYSLTFLSTNVFIYFVISLVSFKLTNVLILILLLIIDMGSAAFILLAENKFLRDKFPIPKAIAIFGEPNYDILKKVYKYRDILLTVEKKIDVKDINFRKLDQLLKDYDRVITVDVDHNRKKQIFKVCYENFIRVLDIPSISDMLIASGDIMHVIDTPILKINKYGPSKLERIIKRIFDVVGSLILIIVTSPIMLITAILIKKEDGGTILFKQERITEDGKIFNIYKFRSMIMNAESKTGAVLASKNDDRITRIGSFIRKTRFDELPQLFNILKGDMTFVGPRPERPEIFNEIIKTMPEFRYRLVVKAGLTGYAQIYGKYNTTMRDKLLLDLYYIENYSLVDDIKLLVQTLKIVFKPESTEGIK